MIKKIAFSTFALLASLIFINAVNKTSGGHPSSTGAPGELTCARSGCHSDASIIKDSPVNTFTFSDPNNTYSVDGSYNLSLEVNVPNIKKFGFMIVAIDSATKKNAGTWWITEPLNTHIIEGEAPVTDRMYITHTADGTVPITTGKNKWNFRWQAPKTNVGTIIFYYVTNATNMNDASTGDKLYQSNYKIRYSASSLAVKKTETPKPSLTINENSLIVFSEQQTIQSLKIYNLEGKLVYQNFALKNGDTIGKEELKTFGTSILVYHLVTDKGSYNGKVRV